MCAHYSYLGLVLSGGQSRRMGGDKAVMPFGDATLFEHVLHRLKHQLDDIVISTASDHPVFRDCGHDLIHDLPPFVGMGPLSGLYAAFDYCRQRKHEVPYDGIITVAVDTPFFPEDYVARLDGANISAPSSALIAATIHRPHPTFALWKLHLADALAQHLCRGKYSIVSFADQIEAEAILFPSSCEQDPFFNINTPQELELARNRLLMLK